MYITASWLSWLFEKFYAGKHCKYDLSWSVMPWPRGKAARSPRSPRSLRTRNCSNEVGLIHASFHNHVLAPTVFHLALHQMDPKWTPNGSQMDPKLQWQVLCLSAASRKGDKVFLQDLKILWFLCNWFIDFAEQPGRWQPPIHDKLQLHIPCALLRVPSAASKLIRVVQGYPKIIDFPCGGFLK